MANPIWVGSYREKYGYYPSPRYSFWNFFHFCS